MYCGVGRISYVRKGSDETDADLDVLIPNLYNSMSRGDKFEGLMHCISLFALSALLLGRKCHLSSWPVKSSIHIQRYIFISIEICTLHGSARARS